MNFQILQYLKTVKRDLMRLARYLYMVEMGYLGILIVTITVDV